MMIGFFMIMVDSTIVVIANPTSMADLRYRILGAMRIPTWESSGRARHPADGGHGEPFASRRSFAHRS
jgi:hypothetical protein